MLLDVHNSIPGQSMQTKRIRLQGHVCDQGPDAVILSTIGFRFRKSETKLLIR